MSDESSNLGWILAGVSTVIATLAGVVAKLFHMRETETAKSIVELKQEIAISRQASEKCEKDRIELFAECKVLKFEIDSLKDRIAFIDKEGTEYSHRSMKKDG